MDETEQSVIRARRKLRRSDEEYREALEEAVAAGKSYVDLARLLGISRQAVRQHIERGRKS